MAQVVPWDVGPGGSAFKQVHDVQEVRRMMNSFEYRSWGNRVAVACDLVMRGLCTYRLAAAAARVTPRRIQSGVKSLRDGRDIGVSGHPPLLRQDLRQQLLDMVKDRLDRNVKTTARFLCDEVSRLVFTFRCFCCAVARVC